MNTIEIPNLGQIAAKARVEFGNDLVLVAFQLLPFAFSGLNSCKASTSFAGMGTSLSRYAFGAKSYCGFQRILIVLASKLTSFQTQYIASCSRKPVMSRNL